MTRSHPLWRGFWLALSMTAVLFLLGQMNSLSPFALERKPAVFAGAIAAGALIGTLPSRLKKRGPSQRIIWQRCVRCFLCGSVMALALGMAGGSVVPALMTGSAGAYGFCAAALAGGFVTVRIAGRRRNA